MISIKMSYYRLMLVNMGQVFFCRPNVMIGLKYYVPKNCNTPHPPQKKIALGLSRYRAYIIFQCF